MADKKPSRFRQFGLRTLLVLVAAAAGVCGLAGREAVREERREKLIAELEKSGAQWLLFYANMPPAPPRLWREPIGAWLRGKPMVPPRNGGIFKKGTSPEQLREFLDLFSTVNYVEIDSSDATTEVLHSLASHGPFDGVRFKNPLAIDKERARPLAKISSVCRGGLLFENQDFSDADLKNLSDAGAKFQIVSHDRYFWRNIGDEGLKIIAKQPLNSIVHASCLGTDEGVRAMAGNSSVGLLHLTGPNYTDASADVISSLSGLRYLHFGGTRHTDAGLAKAISGVNLMSIDFDNVAVGNETIAALATIPALTRLSFKGIDLSLEQCDALAKLPLEQLTVHSKTLTDDHIARLAPLANSLVLLELKTPQVTDVGLAWLKEANSLSFVHLDDTQATVATWSSFDSSGGRFQAIGMGGINFNAEMLAWASDQHALYLLVLTGSQVNDATLDLLPQSVEYVTLVDTQVTPDGLKKLAGKKGMKSITVFRESDAPSLITVADVKETQAAVGPSVEMFFKDASWYRCD